MFLRSRVCRWSVSSPTRTLQNSLWTVHPSEQPSSTDPHGAHSAGWKPLCHSTTSPRGVKETGRARFLSCSLTHLLTRAHPHPHRLLLMHRQSCVALHPSDFFGAPTSSGSDACAHEPFRHKLFFLEALGLRRSAKNLSLATAWLCLHELFRTVHVTDGDIN